jgi:hypothetical protein
MHKIVSQENDGSPLTVKYIIFQPRPVHKWAKKNLNLNLLHFVAFFHVASLLSTGVHNEKVGVDNEKALELDNSIFFSYFSLISV